jgi:hypothetical protein
MEQDERKKTEFNRQMQARPNETKLKAGSYCFLATLSVSRSKSKSNLTTLRTYISERF